MGGTISRSQPLVEQVYQHLRDEILQGLRKPGERLVETKLAVELQTSRSPVREAIRLLRSEQLAVDRDGIVSVFNPSYGDFTEIYELRIILETAAVRNAAKRINAQQLKVLSRNLDRTSMYLECRNMDKIVELNNEFHRCIWNASGNYQFYRTLDNISVLIHYYCSLVLKMIREQTNILHEHRIIYEALLAYDAVTAEDAMKSHIAKDMQVISLAYQQLQDNNGEMMM